MIFTVGNTENYDRYFREQKTPKKKGRTPNYTGGTVWKTFLEAEKHLRPGYSVYGVDADWETETEKSAKGDWHDLLVDSNLIKL